MLTTQPDDSDASLYQPSDVSASADAEAPFVPIKGPGAREMVRLMELEPDSNSADTQRQEGDDAHKDARVDHEEEDEERKTDTEPLDNDCSNDPELPTPSEKHPALACAESASDNQAATAPLFQASLVTPTSPLAAPEYIDLLAQLHRQGPVPETEEVALKKASRDNKLAFGVWKKPIIHRHPEVKAQLHRVTDPAAACNVLIQHLPLLFDMLRHLPYVPVLAGRVRRDLFADIGKHLLVLGRTRMLQRISRLAGISAKTTAFCEEWIAMIESHQSIETQLMMAQLPARWTQLDQLVASLGHNLIRSIPDIKDIEWGALLAHLLVNQSVVRAQLEDLELSDACDVLLRWTAHDRRIHHTVLAAQAFRDGRWLAPTEYLDGLVELSKHPLPPSALAGSGGLSQY